MATFNCFFTVQGRTRLVFSHELDTPSALSELSQYPSALYALQRDESTTDAVQEGAAGTEIPGAQLTYGLSSQQSAVPFFTPTLSIPDTSQQFPLGVPPSGFIVHVHAVTSYRITPGGVQPVQLSAETFLPVQQPGQPGPAEENVHFAEVDSLLGSHGISMEGVNGRCLSYLDLVLVDGPD